MPVSIASSKATQKITKAMQMVAASKLRRAQVAAEAARPYAEKMDAVISNIAAAAAGSPGARPLLAGTGRWCQTVERRAGRRGRGGPEERGEGSKILLRRPQRLRTAAPHIRE